METKTAWLWLSLAGSMYFHSRRRGCFPTGGEEVTCVLSAEERRRRGGSGYPTGGEEVTRVLSAEERRRRGGSGFLTGGA